MTAPRIADEQDDRDEQPVEWSDKTADRWKPELDPDWDA